MTLHRIRLELGRVPGQPEGNPGCGYDLVAPLDREHHLDPHAWPGLRSACTVHRFWEGEASRAGHLIRTGNHRWVFSYAPGEEDDQPVFRLEDRAFVPGEYLSITEHDGVARPFRVASVAPAG